MPNKVLQEWECLVDEVTDGIVYLRLYDLTDKTTDTEVAEIPIEGLGDAGKDLQPGTILYWSIEVTEDGKTLSIFKPHNVYWTQEELDAAKEEAEKLFAQLVWE